MGQIRTISTNAFAMLKGVTPEAVRRRVLRTGTYDGVCPEKLDNGRLRFPLDEKLSSLVESKLFLTPETIRKLCNREKMIQQRIDAIRRSGAKPESRKKTERIIDAMIARSINEEPGNYHARV